MASTFLAKTDMPKFLFFARCRYRAHSNFLGCRLIESILSSFIYPLHFRFDKHNFIIFGLHFKDMPTSQSGEVVLPDRTLRRPCQCQGVPPRES